MYLVPAFMIYDASRDDPITAAVPWSANGAIDALHPIGNVGDLRAQTQARWTSAATSHYAQLDRGGTNNGRINSLVMVNTNLNGKTMKIESDANDAFSSPTTFFTEATINPSLDPTVWNYYPLTADITERYVRISFPTVSVAPRIGQLWLTHLDEISSGFSQIHPDLKYQNTLESDNEEFDDDSIIILGRARTRIKMSWQFMLGSDALVVRQVATGIQAGNPVAIDHDGSRSCLVRLPYFESEDADGVVKMMDAISYSIKAADRYPKQSSIDHFKVSIDLLENFS